MDSQYYNLLNKKEALKKDNRDMLIGGIIMVLLAYVMVTRPSFPSKELFTWNSLLSLYGAAFYVGASFVAGWKLLHNFTSKFFLFLPLIGWLIYLFLKIAMALFVGSYLYGVFRYLNNLYQINRINKQIINS
ncbi:hypothetical protein [Myroides phaeus]|uniref:Uncharacterized protein n=1 Tax=Myroides phaeus TaxID=702745 RepID=A0A1G8H9G5_9FLAO|nr:hypothetical protein [Myroides phaeus]SDI03292.1 hypothetical protein SAMN05421818_1502 [Myroides phaeus]